MSFLIPIILRNWIKWVIEIGSGPINSHWKENKLWFFSPLHLRDILLNVNSCLTEMTILRMGQICCSW